MKGGLDLKGFGETWESLEENLQARRIAGFFEEEEFTEGEVGIVGDLGKTLEIPLGVDQVAGPPALSLVGPEHIDLEARGEAFIKGEKSERIGARSVSSEFQIAVNGAPARRGRRPCHARVLI